MKYILFIFFSIIAISAKSQLPSTLPTVNTTGWYKLGYLKTDSGRIDAVRDTNWTPKYIPTTVYWEHAGTDS